MTDERRLYPLPEAARLLDVSVRILNVRVDAKRLPWTEIAGQRWVTLEDAANCLPEWIKEQRTKRNE